MTELTEWTVLGRKIGKASGWDENGNCGMMLYDFEPAIGVNLPSGTLAMDFESGWAETYDDDGKVTASCDLAAALASLPITTKASS
jgi:hypothetical protein